MQICSFTRSSLSAFRSPPVQRLVWNVLLPLSVLNFPVFVAQPSPSLPTCEQHHGQPEAKERAPILWLLGCPSQSNRYNCLNETLVMRRIISGERRGFAPSTGHRHSLVGPTAVAPASFGVPDVSIHTTSSVSVLKYDVSHSGGLYLYVAEEYIARACGIHAIDRPSVRVHLVHLVLFRREVRGNPNKRR